MDPQTIISELVAAGVTQTEIAQHIGLNQSGVSRLHSGEQHRISYEVGARLDALHRRYRRRIKSRTEDRDAR
jgi:transcriptional regulator with XRE-family HTH domain